MASPSKLLIQTNAGSTIPSLIEKIRCMKTTEGTNLKHANEGKRRKPAHKPRHIWFCSKLGSVHFYVVRLGKGCGICEFRGAKKIAFQRRGEGLT